MVTIIVPVLNEAITLNALLAKLTSLFNNDEQIILVDNGSTDNSLEIINKYSVVYRNIEVYSCANKGKANAIRSILEHIKYDDVILQDADLEYSLNDVYKLYQLHRLENADMTIGVRSNKLYTSSVANTLIRRLFKLRFGSTVSDVLTGARIIKKDMLKKCKANGFAIETELTYIALKNKLKICEGSCEYYPRHIGKKIKPYHLLSMMKVALWH